MKSIAIALACLMLSASQARADGLDDIWKQLRAGKTESGEWKPLRGVQRVNDSKVEPRFLVEAAVFAIPAVPAAIMAAALPVIMCMESKVCNFEIKPQKHFEPYKRSVFPQGDFGSLPPSRDAVDRTIRVRVKKPLNLESKSSDVSFNPKVAATLKKSKRLAKIAKINRDSFKPTYEIGF